MKKLSLISIGVLYIVLVAWAAITLPIASRQEIWTPGTYTGYTGGIPTNRVQFCNVKVLIPGTNIVAVGDGVTDDKAAIMAAIRLCPTNGTIYLPPSVYRIASDFTITGTTIGTDCNYFTLEGAGNSNSVIFWDPSSSGAGFNKFMTIGGSKLRDNPFNANFANFQLLSSDAPSGTYSVTLAAIPSNMINGGMITFDEENDDIVVSSLNYTDTHSTAYNTDGDGIKNHTYTAVITNITGTTVKFTPPIPVHGFLVANAARVFSMNNLSGGGTRVQYKGIGLKGLTFAFNTNNAACVAASQNWGIKFDGCSDLYIKDCYFQDLSRFYIYPSACANVSIVRNFLGRQFGAATVDVAYGMDIRGCSNFQIEDNIFYQMYTPLVLANCSRFYIGYNFFYDILTQGGTGTQGSEINYNHGAHNYAHNIEGNEVGRIQGDRAHGSSGNITIIGNLITGTGKTVTQNRYALSMDSGSWSNTVMGNVLGYPGMDKGIFMPTNASFSTSSNIILRAGYPFIGNNYFDHLVPGSVTNRDLTVTNTMIYHGNYDYVNNGYIYDPTYDSTIPKSMVYSSRPEWYGGYGWPPFGINGYGGSISNLLPAKARFFGLSDPLFGLGSSRPGLMPLY